VVTDRYAGSSLAYQGYGRGLGIADVRWLSDWATEGLWPDLVILLDVPPTETQGRLAASGVGPDRLEAAGDDFHRHVAKGFQILAQETPDTWRVVDGSGSVDEVFFRVQTTVAEFFALCG
jgi:dTMP kinase